MTATTSHATTVAAPAWQYALCAQTDPDLFFPEGPGGKTTKALEQAKRICGQCPIRSACLEWALETRQSSGVWGGLDETERRQVLGERLSQSEQCWAQREWIEAQLAAGVSLRKLADQLQITRTTLARCVNQFEAERAVAAVKEVQPA